FLQILGIYLLCNDIFGRWTILRVKSMNYGDEKISRRIEFDRTNIPKNILVGSYYGGISHLRPPLEISKILIERGYNVALIAPGNFTLNYLNIKFFPTDLKIGKLDSREIYDEVFKEDYTSYHTFSLTSDLMNSDYLKLFEIYMKVASEFKPDLFFCDDGSNEVCFDVAWKLKKPSIAICTWLIFRLYTPYRSDPSLGCHVNMEHESFIERFRCAIIAPIQYFYQTRKYTNDLNKLRAIVGVAPTSNYNDRLKDSLYFSDSFFGFDVPIHLPPLVQDVGPIMQDEYEPITPDFSLFLEKHKKTMLVSLGTNVYTTPKNYAILLQSFTEAINRKIIDGVIWSFNQRLHNSLPSELILSDGTIIPVNEILNNRNPNIYIVHYLPQFELLNHTNVKVFLSHAGKASSNEALYTATPILSLPIAFDQMGNAEALEASGVSLTLSKQDLQVEDIISKIERLLSEDSFKLNGKRMQALAMINSKRKYRAADMIEYLLLASQLTSESDDALISGINKGNINESEFTNSHLRELITPDTRMGFIRGQYLDVFGSLLGGILIILSAAILLVWFIVRICVSFIMLRFRIMQKTKKE
ncbi:31891_t:CDS:2, partial [Gigaspora margarita]